MIKLNVMLANGMIIQRGCSFPVWTAKKVSVTFLGKTYEAQKVDGKWLSLLDPVQAGGPFSMEITSDEETILINDIYSGDVWLCAGQSNMEIDMQRVRDNYPDEWEIDFPVIRQFKVPQEWDFKAPRDELTGGSWVSASKDTLCRFSAVGWFFAKKMYEKYRIPIGLVGTAWGGTPIESWMSREALSDFPEKSAEARRYADPAFCKELTERNSLEIARWEESVKKEDLGLIEKWQNTVTDISSWDDITLPGDFKDAGLDEFCGVIWLARDFEVKKSFVDTDSKIWLGTIIDADTVFVNGTEIGNTGYRYPPRKYPVRAGLLKEGKNRVAIRVTCNSGDGGVTKDKPFKIFTADETVELAGTWKYKIGKRAAVRPQEFFYQRLPTGNYNAMIAPILKYPLKGVLWYQGESNDPNPNEYEKLFKLMIQDWRKNSCNKGLPFIFVQLPIFGEPSDNNEKDSWPVIRQAQSAAMSIPDCGMAAALEFGEYNDIHPLNKKGIGYLLFLAAEKTIFNVKNSSPGSVLRSYEKRDGKLYLYFDNCGGGLKADETPFISVIDGDVQKRLSCEIEKNDTLSADISSIKNLKKIFYAWANNPRDRQLYNSEGLPAIPFKIEL